MRVLAPHMSCVVNMPLSDDEPNELEQAIADGYTEIYVITADGIIKHHKLRGENRYIRVKVNSIPGFEAPKLPQAINFLPAGKIPKELFDQILAFFYGVMKKNGDKALEAMAWICYSQERGYHIIIPDQQISAASVRYDWSSVPAGTSIIVDIHSHNNMNAFFSGTDNNDDRANISFSGVVGKMNQTVPETVWRFNYQDRKFEAKFEDIFDVAPVEVPDEWLDKVEVSTPRITYVGGGKWPSSTLDKKGRADHLKPYQFRKKEDLEKDLINGNRAGPQLQARNRALMATGHLDFDSDFWGMGDEAGMLANGYVAGGKNLGKAVGEEDGSNEVADPFSPNSNDDEADLDLSFHPRYDELVCNQGKGVAEAYCVIDHYMSELAGQDELLQELISDMFDLSSDSAQIRIFRQLYQHLSPSAQESLASKGF